jgi:hypothetical protein
MAILKPDFLLALESAIESRPAAADAYRAGDPRLLAMTDAVATMFAMLSQQLDAAEAEPFLKARSGTILADAALKGILPLAKPAKVRIEVSNPPDGAAVTIAAGRVLLDSRGRRYVVDGSATIAAGATAEIAANQLSVRSFDYTVAASLPFLEVEVPPSEDGGFLAGIDVAEGGDAFVYAPDFCNASPGQRVFHVETDERRRVFVRFGADGVAGHQPVAGEVLSFTIRECMGAVELEAGDLFTLEYVLTGDEALLGLALSSVDAMGAAPPDIETLRVLSRYQALHDANAVYLADFDFLLRRQLANVRFLSVWNEQVEESVRGANVGNMNRLFVAYDIVGQAPAASETQIRSIIGRADDSYAVTFVPVRLVQVPITVTAQVAAVHDPAAVAAQIRQVLLSLYGQTSAAASRGMSKGLRMQALNAALKAGVVALQDQVSDFTVTLGATPPALPEDFRYFSSAAMSVAVERITDSVGLWSA